MINSTFCGGRFQSLAKPTYRTVYILTFPRQGSVRAPAPIRATATVVRPATRSRGLTPPRPTKRKALLLHGEIIQ